MTEYVRVPREPTPEMVRAGCAVTCVECFADCKSSDAAAVYRAMLAASPQGQAMTFTVRVPRGAGHCNDDAAWAEFERQYRGQPRSFGHMTDFELANAVFMADRYSFDLISYQTAAKERIRWLSLRLAEASAMLAASPQGEGSPIGQNDQPGLAFSDAGEP